jgi:hypothetical protein
MSNSYKQNEKNIENNNFILDKTTINEQINEQIKKNEEKLDDFNISNTLNTLNTSNTSNTLDNSDDDYIYEYKMLIIGAAGATIELVKTKKI